MDYAPWLTLEENRKGVLDLDITKGCSSGLALNKRGCYGLCYAAREAHTRGFNFSKTVVRKFHSQSHYEKTIREIRKSRSRFVRIGTSGDPSEAWDGVKILCRLLIPSGKPAVIVTKHWFTASDEILRDLIKSGTYLNTSISALDTEAQREYRLEQYYRYTRLGGYSVLRVVTVNADSRHSTGEKIKRIQDDLLSRPHVIDDPLRAPRTYPLVKAKIIRLTRDKNSGGSQLVSLHRPDIWTDTCYNCPDQCGLLMFGANE